MRWTVSIISCLAVACPVAAQGAAERFAAMEKALRESKSLRVGFETELKGKTVKDTVDFKGTLLFAPGNKARFEVAYRMAGKDLGTTLICDGKTIQVSSPGEKPRDKPFEANLNRNFVTMLERAGFVVTMFTIRAKKDGAEPDLTKVLTVSNLRLVSANKEHAVLYYRLTIDGLVVFHVDLTVDAKTNLPLSRVLDVEKGADRVVIVETYRAEREPMIDAKAFEPRKE